MAILESVPFLAYIIPFIFVLTIVVFFHELGHYWVGRKCGARIDVFSIGFGRSITRWTDSRGTEWRLCWLPLGGYVKFSGDENAASAPDHETLEAMTDSERTDILHFKPLWQRAATVAAGPFANFLLAIVIFAGLYMGLGERVIRPVIGEVISNSAAARAGFMPDDLVLEIDGAEIESFAQMQRTVTVNAETVLRFTIERDSHIIELDARPDRYIETDRFGNEYPIGRLGVSVAQNPDYLYHKRYNPLTALAKGTYETWFIIEQTFVVLGKIITGRESADNLGGPVRIAQISGQTATLGIVALLNLTAILSVSIGLINLFPIPMLDGGHLAFYAVEAVRGRPLSPKTQERAMQIGLSLVLLLFAFVTWNDLSRLELFR